MDISNKIFINYGQHSTSLANNKGVLKSFNMSYTTTNIAISATVYESSLTAGIGGERAALIGTMTKTDFYLINDGDATSKAYIPERFLFVS